MRWTAALLLGTHAMLLGWGALRHSPTRDEAGHLPAAVSHWRFGRFDLYRVNPPLVRMIAATPLLAFDLKFRWDEVDLEFAQRREFPIGRQFIEDNGEEAFWCFTLARWACIPISLGGGYVCFRWSREMYGPSAAIFALTLWCFCPNILAHGQLITPDVGAAALGLAAAYFFRLWLQGPTYSRAFSAGLFLGLAELAKFTWLVLFPLWLVLWLAWRWAQRQERRRTSWLHEGCQLAAVLLVGVFVINLLYGFEGSFRNLGAYTFTSRTLGGAEKDVAASASGRNRFTGTALANVPVPLPENYVLGLDMQKERFEGKMWSYLGSEWKWGGWWYYYLYALAVKVPLGTWCLAILAMLCGLFRRGYAHAWREEILLLCPAVLMLIVVSSQTGINHHLRYALPALPFLFVHASRAARATHLKHPKTALVVVVLLLESVASSLAVYPHSLSYFNALAGGPRGGHVHLGGSEYDSNVDWGQDLLYLKRWCASHPEVRFLGVAFNGGYSPHAAGIESTLPPLDPRCQEGAKVHPDETGPMPGWYALSVNRICSRTRDYEYFLHFSPVATAGYSIRIYHILPAEADHVRRELRVRRLGRHLPLGPPQRITCLRSTHPTAGYPWGNRV